MKKSLFLLFLLLPLLSVSCSSTQDGTVLIAGVTALETEHSKALDSWSNITNKSSATPEVKSAILTEIAASRRRTTQIANGLRLTVSKLLEVNYDALMQQALGLYMDVGGPTPPPLPPVEGGVR